MIGYSLNVDLFWKKVEKQDGCWPWKGAQNRGTRYGFFHVKVGDKWGNKSAHRISYELSIGDIPEGMHIDHICFNRICVNPDHLRPVTQKQNMEHLHGPYVTGTSGVRGVTFHKDRGKWLARVGHFGKRINVGLFESLDDAEAAVIAKRNELFTHNDEANNLATTTHPRNS